MLIPYQRRARFLLISLLHGEGPAKHRMLQEYQSRLIRVLQVINDKLLPHKRTGSNRYAEQLSIINTCLSAYLYHMCQDMDWHTGGRRIYFTSNITLYSKPGDHAPLLEDNGRLKIVSEPLELAITKGKLTRTEAELMQKTSELVKTSSELVKTSSELTESKMQTALMRERAEGAEALAAEMRLRAERSAAESKRSADIAESIKAEFAAIVAQLPASKDRTVSRLSFLGKASRPSTKESVASTAYRP